MRGPRESIRDRNGNASGRRISRRLRDWDCSCVADALATAHFLSQMNWSNIGLNIAAVLLLLAALPVLFLLAIVYT